MVSYPVPFSCKPAEGDAALGTTVVWTKTSRPCAEPFVKTDFRVPRSYGFDKTCHLAVWMVSNIVTSHCLLTTENDAGLQTQQFCQLWFVSFCFKLPRFLCFFTSRAVIKQESNMSGFFSRSLIGLDDEKNSQSREEWNRAQVQNITPWSRLCWRYMIYNIAVLHQEASRCRKKHQDYRRWQEQ